MFKIKLQAIFLHHSLKISVTTGILREAILKNLTDVHLRLWISSVRLRRRFASISIGVGSVIRVFMRVSSLAVDSKALSVEQHLSARNNFCFCDKSKRFCMPARRHFLFFSFSFSHCFAVRLLMLTNLQGSAKRSFLITSKTEAANEPAFGGRIA